MFGALDLSQPKKAATEERPAVSPVKPAAAAPAPAPAVVNTDDLLSSLSSSSSVLDGDFKMPSFSSTSTSSIFGGDNDMFGSANGGSTSAAAVRPRGAAKIGLFDDPTPSSTSSSSSSAAPAKTMASSSGGGGDDSFDIFSNPLMGKKEKEEREKKRREEEERQAKAAAPPPDIFADPLAKGSSSFF